MPIASRDRCAHISSRASIHTSESLSGFFSVDARDAPQVVLAGRNLVGVGIVSQVVNYMQRAVRVACYQLPARLDGASGVPEPAGLGALLGGVRNGGRRAFPR